MPTIEATGGFLTVASGDEAAPIYSVKAVDMTGAGSELTLAEPKRVRWTLNAPDEYEVTFPKGAYSTSDLGVLVNDSNAVTELQIYRNGDLLTWGPIVQMEAAGSQGEVRCTGAGVDWYLNRRFIDAPIPNMISNGDFESGTSGWNVNSSTLVETTDSTNFFTGTNSLKMVSTDTGDNQLYRSFSSQPNGVGLLIVFSAWFFIETYNGPPAFFMGMIVNPSYNGVEQMWQGFAIDNATEQRVWKKATCQVWVPPNQSWDFTIRLFGIDGTIYWDDVKAVAMYSLGTPGVGADYFKPVDISILVQEIVSFEQQTSKGKSDLHIGGHFETVGFKQSRAYQFVDHMQFDQALREFIERNDGFDYYVQYTPTTRTFWQYAGKRGVDRTGDIALLFLAGDLAGSNCVDYHLSADAGQCVTHQTMLGEDNGPEREQGDYTDATQVGGIVLEDVRQAPQDTKVASLQPMAVERVDRYKYPPQTVEMKIRGDSGLIPTLKPGDLVGIGINDGYVGVLTSMRIQELELDCVTNVLTATCARDTLS